MQRAAELHFCQRQRFIMEPLGVPWEFVMEPFGVPWEFVLAGQRKAAQPHAAKAEESSYTHRQRKHRLPVKQAAKAEATS